MPNDKTTKIKQLNKRIQRVNAAITRTEKKYGADSQIMKRIKATIEHIYGEGVERYQPLKGDESLRMLSKVSSGIGLVERSPYTFKKNMTEHRKNIISDIAHDIKTDTRTAAKILDIFENNVDWAKVREISGKGMSSQVVETIAHEIEQTSENAQKIKDIISEYVHDSTKTRDFVSYLLKRL